jgi:hypothetical protein
VNITPIPFGFMGITISTLWSFVIVTEKAIKNGNLQLIYPATKW